MESHFIETVAVNNSFYLFSFTKDLAEDKYLVTALNRADIPPFVISRDREAWHVPDGSPEAKIFEKPLAELIEAVNAERNDEVEEEIIKRIQAYSQKYQDEKPNRDKLEIRIDTLTLDLKISKEHLMPLLIKLQDNGRIKILPNNSQRRNGPRLPGSVTLVD